MQECVQVTRFSRLIITSDLNCASLIFRVVYLPVTNSIVHPKFWKFSLQLKFLKENNMYLEVLE